ncbi:Aste57867_3530 [Aphanomyces stellatus]|uniref:Aste57867_3530 protein n=1 Tax=Aphanomyces stellatus TaxID=120398 RepID=A0A485KEB3_9STRA|nr:hypothetical protein As57867_003519 [Aphanomyces stellatus]VFT80693.1 Aste57867_3530 [Aphanomyces stellatus]
MERRNAMRVLVTATTVLPYFAVAQPFRIRENDQTESGPAVRAHAPAVPDSTPSSWSVAGPILYVALGAAVFCTMFFGFWMWWRARYNAQLVARGETDMYQYKEVHEHG